MNSKSVCLNMIVKDESKVIKRCLSSVIGIVDYWVIVDTGSTDGTQKIVLEYLRDMPGELHEQKWQNFERNRNGALELARNKCDYILCMDADDTFEFSIPFDKNALENDCYMILCRDPVVDSYRLLMINNDPSWKWAGILHEELQISHPVRGGILSGVIKNGLARDGQRAQDPKRYLKDALLLENAFQEDPANCRTIFYLAQSYLMANEHSSALKYFQLRAAMAGCKDELFWSLYTIGCLQEDLKMPPQTVIEIYQKAHQFDCSRAEPLCALARFLIKIGDYNQAYRISKAASLVSFPETYFFVERDVYEFKSLLYLSYCQHLTRRYDEAKSSYQQLLTKKSLPPADRQTVEQFLALCQKKECIQIITEAPLQ